MQSISAEFQRTFFQEGEMSQSIKSLVGQDFDRMMKLSMQCHEDFIQNLDAIEQPIQYVLIGEAAPFHASKNNYLYHSTPANLTWRKQIADAFKVENEVPEINESGLLFIDLLPYCADYSRCRGNDEYKRLINFSLEGYLPWLMKQIRARGVRFKNVKIAFAMQSIGKTILEEPLHLKRFAAAFGINQCELLQERWKQSDFFFDHFYKENGVIKQCKAHEAYPLISAAQGFKGDSDAPAAKKSYYSISKLSKYRQIAADTNGPKALLIQRAFQLDIHHGSLH